MLPCRRCWRLRAAGRRWRPRCAPVQTPYIWALQILTPAARPGNFDAAALQEAAAFCRARGVKCYLAFNTELLDGELPRAEQALRAAGAAGVDAVIVQDLAAAALVRRCVPGAALHASTQMSVHSPAGIRQLAALGFSRAILAREMSLAELRARCKRKPHRA